MVPSQWWPFIVIGMTVLRSGLATSDIVLDEKNQMKKEKDTDQSKLNSLLQTKESLAKQDDYENNLKELCARIVPDIENCTNQDKKDAYTYLDLAIKASPEAVDVKDYLDPIVLTTGQTRGCLLFILRCNSLR